MQQLKRWYNFHRSQCKCKMFYELMVAVYFNPYVLHFAHLVCMWLWILLSSKGLLVISGMQKCPREPRMPVYKNILNFLAHQFYTDAIPIRCVRISPALQLPP